MAASSAPWRCVVAREVGAEERLANEVQRGLRVCRNGQLWAFSFFYQRLLYGCKFGMRDSLVAPRKPERDILAIVVAGAAVGEVYAAAC